jgi:hypothetical protein
VSIFKAYDNEDTCSIWLSLLFIAGIVQIRCKGKERDIRRGGNLSPRLVISGEIGDSMGL